MNNNILAVCDLEEEYAHRFMNYLNQKNNIPFKIQVFTTVENLLTFAKDRRVELLLISEKAMCPKIQELETGAVIILSEGARIKDYEQYPQVYKYQSSQEVLREIMALYGESKSKTDLQFSVLKKNTKVLGIFSPVGRCGKTVFAVTLSQLLGKYRPTLFLTLDDYSGFPELAGAGYKSSLSDLLYFAGNNMKNLMLRADGIIQNRSHMDFIPSVANPMDITTSSAQCWERLINALIDSSSYEYVVLDIGHGMPGTIDLLNFCSRIYVPVLTDEPSEHKLQQYEQNLQNLEETIICEKMKKIHIPQDEVSNLQDLFSDQLLYSALGKFALSLIKEDRLL